MKKFLVLLLALSSLAANAAGTVTVTTNFTPDGRKVRIDWVADASDGSVPNTTIALSGFVVNAVTVPGSTAPTDNYDIELMHPDSSTLDALGGALLDRDTTTPEQKQPVLSGAATAVYLSGSYIFKLSNNSVHSATGSLFLYLLNP